MRSLKSALTKRIPAGLLILALSVCLTGCRQNALNRYSATDNPDFENYLTELFCQELSENTLNLHYALKDPAAYGITSYTPTLGDFSAKQRRENQKQLKQTAKRLADFSYASLSRDQQLDYDILSDYLKTQLKLCDYMLYEEALAPSGGMQSELPLLLAEYRFDNRRDVEDYLQLLSQVYEYFAQLLEFEQEKADAGLFMSDALCNRTIQECEDFIADEKDHYLAKTFETKLRSLDGLTEEEITSYLSQNRIILTERVFPAYRLLISGLTKLMGCGRNNWGLCHYKEGSRYYEQLIYAYTGRSCSVDTLWEEIAAQRNEDLLACAKLQNENPNILADCAALEWESQEPSAMLSVLENAMLTDFPSPPETTCEICYVDPALEDFLAPAFYIVSPIDQYKSHTIYINSAKNYEDIYYFTTLAHEGFPGHLYQNVMTSRYGSRPIRSVLNYPGYTEGWATYVEMLSYYYAGLSPEAAAMLQYNQSATLSLYASADIGIHYLGWKQKEIYEFWSSYGITGEDTIDRITSLILAEPGNYLKYYAGYLGFLDLKKTMQKACRENFQIQEFHRTLLEIGPAPFDLIQKYFDAYYCGSSVSGSSRS